MNPSDARYHDHVLVSTKNNCPIITLCDGSGHNPGAAEIAITTAEAAHKKIAGDIQNCKDIHGVLLAQLNALNEANEASKKSKVIGSSTTFIQTAVVGNTLTGVVLGDSKVFIFRPKEGGGWHAIDPLGNIKGTLDGTVAGGQIVGQKGQYSDMHNIHAFTYPLNAGDVVYVCSDGVVDNFDPSTSHAKDSKIKPEEWEVENPKHIQISLIEAQQKMEEVVKNCKSGQEIGNAINNYIEKLTTAKKLMLATTAPMERVNMRESNFPGKLDDAASAFYVHNP